MPLEWDQINEDETQIARYDNINERCILQAARAKQGLMFILPEYQQMEHIFRKIDPSLTSRITDEASLEKAAVSLHQSYLSCLQRLENPTGQGPYNLVVTKDWIMMVNRSRPYYG